MHIEAEAIPYESARLRGERLLVLAPHPDDEVIGCGGVVAQHLREGRTVRVVVATDGAAGNLSAANRQEESRKGLARLGPGSEIEFLDFPDRGLDDAVIARLREILVEFRPDLVAVPSLIEIHPDHFALARAFCDLIQRDETLFADLATSRVAFYEVGQPLRPNALVDISEVAEDKYAAIGEHRSQLSIRDYVAFARGLNAYRAMTLPPPVTYAEAYYVLELPELRTQACGALRTRMGSAPMVQTTRAVIPVSVVIRTKDRPALLEEAIASVRATGYPCEIVVVNDGGDTPRVDGVQLVNHDQSLGRSAAANAGVAAASNDFVAFLDDDDRFYPEHLSTLANAACSSPTAAGWYTDAVSVLLRVGESGSHEPYESLRNYGHDFDRELLLIDNYIPLPTLLIPRESFLELGGFDPEFDLFEDWDFLIRLSARGQLVRIPRITVEVRHFEGGSSIILSAREGTARFRAAKKQLWQKHAGAIDNDLLASVFERQKSRLRETYSQLVEARGAISHHNSDLARGEREKRELLKTIGQLHETINGHALRVRELEAANAALGTLVAEHAQMRQETAALRQENAELQRMRKELERARAELQASHDATSETARAAHVEIERLNGLLNLIFSSKTWKMHTALEKLRGRG